MKPQQHTPNGEILAEATSASAWSWVRSLCHRLSTSFIDDVPAELEVCEQCRDANCGGEKFAACQTRLSYIALLKK